MFYDKYCELCKRNGISPTKAAAEIGLGMGTPTAWKKRGTYPNPAQAKKVANYFNVSIDWLMDNDIEKQPTEGELSGIRKDLMDFADTLTDEKIEKYLRLMKTLESEDI